MHSHETPHAERGLFRCRIYECSDCSSKHGSANLGRHILKSIISAYGHFPASLCIAVLQCKTMKRCHSMTVNPLVDNTHSVSFEKLTPLYF